MTRAGLAGGPPNLEELSGRWETHPYNGCAANSGPPYTLPESGVVTLFERPSVVYSACGVTVTG